MARRVVGGENYIGDNNWHGEFKQGSPLLEF